MPPPVRAGAFFRTLLPSPSFSTSPTSSSSSLFAHFSLSSLPSTSYAPSTSLSRRHIFIEVPVKGALTRLGEEVGSASPSPDDAPKPATKAAFARVEEATRHMRLKDELMRRRRFTVPYDARRKYADTLAYGATKAHLLGLARWIGKKDGREKGGSQASMLDQLEQPWKLPPSKLRAVGAISENEYQDELEAKRILRERRKRGGGGERGR